MHIILGAPKTEEIKPLIKSPGLVIGVDRGALMAIEEGIALDIALGDFDSVSAEEKRKVQRYAKEMHNFPTNKDDTDAELALLYVLDNLADVQIYLYNWSGGRMDHLYSLFMLVLQERFLPLVSSIQFIASNNVIAYYLPGEYTLKKIDQMTYLSFILLTEVEKLTLDNVSYPLKEASFSLPRALISNEFVNKQARLSFTEGIVAVIQSRDAS